MPAQNNSVYGKIPYTASVNLSPYMSAYKKGLHFARVCSIEMQALKNTKRDVNMNRPKSRKYVSPAREQQALATKNRILDAAEKLLLEKGFAAMTVAEVAKLAEVSPQTVYAVFSSKAGIISAAVEDRVTKDKRNIGAIKELHEGADPARVLQIIAQIVCSVYQGDAPTFAAVYGTRMVSRELAELEMELGEHRREKQADIAKALFESGKTLPHLSLEDVHDILWVFTGREIYYLLVICRGWSAERYEKQLYAMLVTNILGPHVL
ncbi:MAG: hypothetical protein DELT_01809 [Desulfovibrio sp.]